MKYSKTKMVQIPIEAIGRARTFQAAQLARPTQPFALGALVELGYQAWLQQTRAPRPEDGEGDC